MSGATGDPDLAAGVRRRWQQGVAWARDYAWIARAQVAASLRRQSATPTSGAGAPVLLLPGIYETWPVMGTLARALHAAGHPVHTVPALGLNHRPLEASAQHAAAQLTELDLRGVVLVAHSKGGLIGKLLLTHPEVGPRVAGLVAVNTPFAGSVYARWFPARSVRALSPRDPHVLALARDVAAHARIWSVHARFDPHVPGGSELAGAVNVRLPLDGHFRLLDDPRLHAAVVEAVARLAAPGQGPAGT
ncbi:putative lipase transmembrane protein [Cellulomonas flavigena DSM 20109]|uniref:Putative lipase transmembrane protein n=1 Tax=Cellulomonas flavigena (strain ATCC 482 / DSM 20109 / BCRC 11376 / JCM 18109 / NBRC 3775 / NCIMB 8073 / NRS 134) TaxID=446466 RepID=D5UBV2_CELFN|nr:lipase [Cellulomonas flavigena]ADG74197.1 putative lipase transmembrane protein [Cellulomonas flavigena DSM 20109]